LEFVLTSIPDIVLVHGFPLDAEMWSSQVAFLKKTGARIFTPDLPGFGQRARNPAHRCSISAFAEDIHHYILRNCKPPCIVGGFSMGGYAVLAMLNRFAKDACAAILIDTHPAADSADGRQRRLQSIADIQAHGITPLVEQMPPRLLAPTASEAVRERVRRIIARQNPVGMIQAQMAAAMRVDQTALLSSIKVPCLVMGGAMDVITPPDLMKGWQQKISRSQWVEIADAGHLSPMEAPDAVNRVIAEFINSTVINDGQQSVGRSSQILG
jgi:pimeloyl-ACP methyl ester carboxylesterase